MLDVLPHSLVGIELRRVRWEVEELETSLGRGDKLLGLAGLVGGMSVDDQVDRTLHVVEKLLQVLDEAGGIHPAGETEVQLAFGRDRRDHVERGSPACSPHDWGPSPLRPGRPRMVIGAYPCLIAEEDRGSGLLGRSSDLGVLLLLPAAGCLGVLLVGPHQWALGRKPHALQEPTHGRLGHLDAVALLDELADHVTRPQGKLEAQLAGVFAEDRPTKPGDLAGGKFGDRTLCLADDERLLPELLVGGPPAVDGRTSHAEGRSDVLDREPLLHQANHLSALFFQAASLDTLTRYPGSGSSGDAISVPPIAADVQ